MKKESSGAIAIFVKTPGLSPIKSRLAKSVGENLALEFYLKSVRAHKSVIKKIMELSPSIKPYWAVAETEGLESPLWGEFDILFQGSGDLGERLCQVYKSLLDRHEFVILIGADSPQVQVSRFVEAIGTLSFALSSKDKEYFPNFVVGPTFDGGFYLFGGRQEIPMEIWTSIPYSDASTLKQLGEKLDAIGGYVQLPIELDVDTGDDLKELVACLDDRESLTSEQFSVLEWLRANFV